MMMSVCFFLLFMMMHVTAQTDFISIDCGGDLNYEDRITQIAYVPDGEFIDTGVNMNVNISNVNPNYQFRRFFTVRSFPEGARNCYTIDAVAGSKYLLRATFLYGNYDGSNARPIVFELHLGVNLWKTMNISESGEMYHTDVITFATAGELSVCLVNIGSGTPFISGLDIRKLDADMYPDVNVSTSLVLSSRYNFGAPAGKFYRYPDDGYDRVWDAFDIPADWTTISNLSTVENDGSHSYEVPPVVMSTAATPVNSTVMESNFTSGGAPENSSIIIFHFAELTNASRFFEISVNGYVLNANYSPPRLSNSFSKQLAPSPTYQWMLSATTGSILPPLINALEVYTQMDLVQLPTDSGDVAAINAIKKEYGMKGNWIGDPCAPMKYSWDGLTCSYDPDPPRIISLNLSSRALPGIISSVFADLTALQYLDLSYNNLTGEIPYSLENLSSLRVLDLTGNNLIKPIPSSLLEKCKRGKLLLRTDDNTQLCDNKKISASIIVILSVVPVILIFVVIVIGWRFKRLHGLVSKKNSYNGLRINEQIQLDHRQFTYMQLAQISSNFVRVLGKGGFGFVYHGYLESGQQVAIKMRSNSSTQGTKEFLAEARNLTKVHHRNLVSLLGYCMDEKHLALVYEYMAKGSVHDHLRGKIDHIGALGWRERLRIAVQAAQGLEYLHKGCKPPIIHRDIKSSNILLGEDMEAKIADFGLSRALQSGDQTHVSTVAVMGTPGYVDPEYHSTLQLNEKSDVYSFGVVLLELITGQPPIIQGSTNVHITWYVTPKLARGELDGIVDERLHGEYDPNSVWKMLDLALRCTAQTRSQRPIMSEVVTQLKDSLELEIACRKSGNMSIEDFGIGQASVFGIGDNIQGDGPSAR